MSCHMCLIRTKETREIQKGCARKGEACPVSTGEVILMRWVYEYVGAEYGFESDMFIGKWDAHASFQYFCVIINNPQKEQTHRACVSVAVKPRHCISGLDDVLRLSWATRRWQEAANFGYWWTMVLLQLPLPVPGNLALREGHKLDHSPSERVSVLSSRVSPKESMCHGVPAEMGYVALNASNETNFWFKNQGRDDFKIVIAYLWHLKQLLHLSSHWIHMLLSAPPTHE